MEQLYANSIEFGRFYAWLLFLVAIVVAVALSWGAFAIRREHEKFGSTAKGVVQDAACEAVKKDLYDCTLDVTYNVAGTEYQVKDVQVNAPTPYKPADRLSLRVSTVDPTLVAPASSLVGLGWAHALLVAAVLILLMAGFRLYLARNFRFAAAGSGVAGLISAFRA